MHRAVRRLQGRAPAQAAAYKSAGSVPPQRTIDPNTRALSTAAASRTASVSAGARYAHAMGTVIASTPAAAATPPCG
jgi:hypothetical protein